MLLFDEEPDFVNDQGVKWWFDKTSTDYAVNENVSGISLPNIKVYYVEELDGCKTRLIIDGNKIIYESKCLEDIAVHIDIMKLSEVYE